MNRTPRSAPDLQSLWSPRTLVAVVVFGEAMAAVLTLGAPDATWVAFGLASLGAQWILLLTLGGLFLARDLLRAQSPRRIALATFITLLLASVLVLAVTAYLLPGLADDMRGGWRSLAIRSLGIVAIVGLLGIAAIENRRRAQALAVHAKQAELDLLQARIRPHFLFNTLNTATALVHGRPDVAERVLLDLADLFRAALGKHPAIPLAEELELTRRYLDIEALRYGDRLRAVWTLPDAIPHVHVPPLSIQPLVENAIRHGIERSRAGGTVRIGVSVLHDRVRIDIRNPLPGDDATAAPQGHGVGLRASTARIEAATRGRGRVRGGIDGSDYVTTVELPLR